MNPPTVFGVREGGRRERVSVTAAGSPSSGGHTITVHMEHVHLSAQPGQIETVGRAVAEKILSAVHHARAQGMTDRQLIGPA